MLKHQFNFNSYLWKVKNLTQHSVILFDGVCNLCNSTIQFIIKKDTKQRFKFASLQSDAAREILLQYSMKNVELKSIERA